MTKGYLFYTPGAIIYIETEKRRTDETARGALDILAAIYKSNADTLKRAKNDRTTLEDVKRRLQPYTLTETATRYIFKNKGGSVFDIPKGAPGYIVLTKAEALKTITA